MFEYGLYSDGDKRNLPQIDSEEKAGAFLRLLDRTVGNSVGATRPMDPSDVLEQIRTVAPNLADSEVFRRLATAAQRV